MFKLSSIVAVAALLSGLLPFASASPKNIPRQAPARPHGVKTITSPNGVEIRYKEPGKAGVCETTPGVNSYSGYVSLNETTNMFFWFFEARKDPAHAPVTLWLNGGPGSDSLIGLFQELGPCSVTEDLKTKINPYAWNEVSNMLFLSQPVGVGFSYATTKVGYYNHHTYHVEKEPIKGETEGRYQRVNPYRFDTTLAAAHGAWEILQGFFTNLPHLDPTVKNMTFNLWTESYGGHYGPVFYDYFYQQNALIASQQQTGIELRMDTLGIINGIVDELIQAPYYPEFARYNTYGIKAVNETIYQFMKTAFYIPAGCLDKVKQCAKFDKDTLEGMINCRIATEICRDLVEVPYYSIGKRGVYDIRHPIDDPTPPQYMLPYLNQASVQEALGVSINYTSLSSDQIWKGFQFTGDFVYRRFLTALERILDSGVRVALTYGDAGRAYLLNPNPHLTPLKLYLLTLLLQTTSATGSAAKRSPSK